MIDRSIHGSLGSRYWIARPSINQTKIEQLRSALTIRPRYPDEPPFVALEEDEDVVGVPRAWGMQHLGAPTQDATAAVTQEQPTRIRFTRELRDYQTRAVDDVCASLTRPGSVGCLLEARTGTGKTVMALSAASRLGARTLIIVNRGLLLEQWKERIQQFTDVTDVGEICQNRCSVDAPIVVGMMQSLACREYPESVLDGFDLVVVDEVHRICAQVMSRSLRSSARWYLGLSATMERSDGRHAFLEWTFGPDRVLVSTDTQIVHIERVPHQSTPSVRRRLENMRPTLTAIQKHAQTISTVAGCTARNRLLAALARAHVDGGRRVLMVSDRVKQLTELHQKLVEGGLDTAQLLTGKTRNRDRAIVEATCVVLATITLVKEGWDGVPHFDTLLVCSPVSNDVVLRQLHGRIMRPHPDKAVPLVVDVCDDTDQSGATRRRRMYARLTREPSAGIDYRVVG